MTVCTNAYPSFGLCHLLFGFPGVAARREGALLLRIDPSTAAELLARPGARPALMGTDRPMGDGWISVEPAALEGTGLDSWLAPALSFHAAQGTK